MANYDNTDRVSVWPNKEQREGKQDADFTGTLNVGGKEYWINLWKRKPDANPKAPSLSGSIREKDQPKARSNNTDPAPTNQPFDDDLDIPF